MRRIVQSKQQLQHAQINSIAGRKSTMARTMLSIAALPRTEEVVAHLSQSLIECNVAQVGQTAHHAVM